MGNITSANTIVTLTCTDVFPAPQLLQGYAADDGFAADSQVFVEVVMGIDGKLSGGYTPSPTNIGITFQADSPSILIMDAIVNAMKVAKAAIQLDLVIVYPALNKTHTLSKGFIKEGSPLPDVKKVLQPQKYALAFESNVRSSI